MTPPDVTAPNTPHPQRRSRLARAALLACLAFTLPGCRDKPQGPDFAGFRAAGQSGATQQRNAMAPKVVDWLNESRPTRPEMHELLGLDFTTKSPGEEQYGIGLGSIDV